MKRKFFAAILATTMMAVSFTGCTTSCSNTSVTGTGNTDQTESTEASVTDVTPSGDETDVTATDTSDNPNASETTAGTDHATTDATSGTDATTSETTTEPAPTTRTVNANGWPSFEMPAQDTTYIDKLIDAGIAPEYYRGTYIAFTETDNENGDIIIYFVNSNTSGKVYDFTDAGDGLSDAEAAEAYDLVVESFYRYFDYYENYDGRKAIDLNGDGKITNTEKNICAFFTCGAEFRGLMIDQIC